MIIKFFNSNKSHINNAFAYLLNEKRTNDKTALLLKGSVELAKNIANQTPNKKINYYSGVLSFAEKNDLLTYEQKQKIMNDFEKVVIPNDEVLERSNWTWIEHSDKNRLELNFILNTNLENFDNELKSKNLSIYHKFAIKRLDLFRDLVDLKFKLKSPKDTGATVNLHRSNGDRYHQKTALAQEINEIVKSEKIEGRGQLIDILKQKYAQKYEISAIKKSSITFLVNGKKIRLEKGLFEENADYKHINKRKFLESKIFDDDAQKFDDISIKLGDELEKIANEQQKKYLGEKTDENKPKTNIGNNAKFGPGRNVHERTDGNFLSNSVIGFGKNNARFVGRSSENSTRGNIRGIETAIREIEENELAGTVAKIITDFGQTVGELGKISERNSKNIEFFDRGRNRGPRNDKRKKYGEWRTKYTKKLASGDEKKPKNSYEDFLKNRKEFLENRLKRLDSTEEKLKNKICFLNEKRHTSRYAGAKNPEYTCHTIKDENQRSQCEQEYQKALSEAMIVNYRAAMLIYREITLKILETKEKIRNLEEIRVEVWEMYNQHNQKIFEFEERQEKYKNRKNKPNFK